MPAKNTRTQSTTPAVTWAEPPPRSLGGGGSPAKYLELAAELKANPGKWAVLRMYDTPARAYSAANHVRIGGLVGFEDGGFEAVGRRNEDGTGTAYVRYVRPATKAKAKTTRTTRARKAKS